MKRAYIVVGLQFGDEAKGATVDFLTREHRADLVVRYSGGYQSAHNVITPEGLHHTFRQFGSGMFAGARTHLGPEFIFCPRSASIEWRMLAEKMRRPSVQPISVDPECLVATPYHILLNWLRSPHHGTTGCGIGATRKYWFDHGYDAIKAGDLSSEQLVKEKLRLLRHRVKLEIHTSPNTASRSDQISDILSKIDDAQIMRSWRDQGWYVGDIDAWNAAVFEGSQGILLDEYHGFHPHTTWSDLTTRNALQLIPENCEIETIGCIRAFTTRHGNGPLPTEFNPGHPEPHNRDDDNAGRFRWGHLSLTLLEYAIRCQPVDYLAMSHLDLYGERGILATHREPRHSIIPRIANQERNTAKISDDLVEKEMSVDQMIKCVGAIKRIGIIATGPTANHRNFV